MYIHLGTATLKTGEQMELGCIRCPDPHWGDQIQPFLGHKSRESRDHFQLAFAGPLDELDTRFYVGTLGGRVVTNVMIVGASRPGAGGSAGILGHVYTLPEHRQKGAYAALMEAQMAHVRQDGYRILMLSTGFETPPYWIYHRFGFRSIDGTSGKMKWLSDPEAEAEWLRPSRPGAARVRPMRWDDWGALEVLTYQPVSAGEELPRSAAFQVKGQGSLEGPFQVVQRNIRRRAPITAHVLESEHGASAGFAVLFPDSFAFGDGLALDLYVHPSHEADAPRLLESISWPEGRPVNAYSTPPEGYRAAALADAGFLPVAELPDWLTRDGERLPLRVYRRSG